MGVMRMFQDLFNSAFAGAHSQSLVEKSKGGYQPVMVKRPVIGVGQAATYFLDGQMVALNSIVGGGTIPTNQPPAAISGAMLDWQAHVVGGPTQRGTLTPSRQLVGLGAQPNYNLGSRKDG